MTESPRLLLKEPRSDNYCARCFRGHGNFALGLIASSFAAFLSMPTAVFITLSYVVTGLFSSYRISSIETGRRDAVVSGFAWAPIWPR